MRSPSNHTVQIGLLNIEINIQSVHDIKIVALAQDIINHLYVCVSFLLISCSIGADLDSSRVKRRVLVLI